MSRERAKAYETTNGVVWYSMRGDPMPMVDAERSMEDLIELRAAELHFQDKHPNVKYKVSVANYKIYDGDIENILHKQWMTAILVYYYAA